MNSIFKAFVFKSFLLKKKSFLLHWRTEPNMQLSRDRSNYAYTFSSPV